jgi:2-polyprenyl-3-methyl-5-hydroxy-6-metoxy-1,4-benzoquinol methylase
VEHPASNIRYPSHCISLRNTHYVTTAAKKAYTGKPESYFTGARRDIVDQLLPNPKGRILEIGCGSGLTGALALAQKKCSHYTGVEISEKAAEIARQRITEVVVGDIEEIIPPWDHASFDVLILSEILEHLVDPWSALKKLRPLMKSGALVFASSPNVSHHTVIRMLIRGRWDLKEDGIMDRGHLRWFTPRSYVKMLQDTGYHVDRVEPLNPLRLKAQIAVALMAGRGRRFFIEQINVKAHCE